MGQSDNVDVVERPAGDEPARPQAQDAPAPGHGRIAALDGVRGLAVALVVAYHFEPGWFPAGFLGVDLFFVLSGFLITSLALSEHRRSGGLSGGAFYARRARRLLPAAVVTVVGVVALAAILEPDSMRATLRGQGVASLLYVANWWSIAQGDSYQAAFGSESPLSHFWSLAVEEQFYLVFPLVVIGLVALLRRTGTPPRRLALALGAIAGLGAAASAILMAALHDPAVDPSRVYFGTDTRLQAVLVGVLGACAVELWPHAHTHPVARRALPWAAGAAAAILLVVAATAGLRDTWLYRFGFLAVAMTGLVLVVAVTRSSSTVTRAFELRWLCVLGLASYSIYLWHWPVRVFLTTDRTGLTDWGLLAARLAVTAAAAAASYWLIERPFRHAGNRRRIATWSTLGVVGALVLVWAVARPVATPAGTSTATAPEVVAPATPAELPPLRVLWLGDSVAWSMGGGHFDYPAPVGFDNPFDPGEIVIWNKADYSCPLVRTPKRSFGLVKVKEGWCVERETTWPQLIDEFSPDVVSWSASLFDTYDYEVDGRWLQVGTPEWDAVYEENLEQARRLATSRGATFLLLSQADPVADPSQTDQESLLPEHLWRWGHLRDLQRRFAEAHPDDTRFVDLQPIVCPADSCAEATLDDPGLRGDGVHFWHGTMEPLVPQVQEAILAAVGRGP